MTVDATDLRMNDAYVFWYNNLAKLIITGLAPFLMLCVFNFKIYNALRMRRLIMGPNATAAHQQQLNEDNRQALVLFSIVIIFLISNVPRIALNLHEVSHVDNLTNYSLMLLQLHALREELSFDIQRTN